MNSIVTVFLIVAAASFTYGVDPADYEAALKDDDAFFQQENATEYPNGVNVIPGTADIHYPIYASIPKSSFSCIGRLPGFYADTELRCQVWHICDEGGIQQSFLCTNGTIYSQHKRVCDWWYNVNCDPDEVNRYYDANKELYKGPPPKEGSEATSNEIVSPQFQQPRRVPPPPPPPQRPAPTPTQNNNFNPNSNNRNFPSPPPRNNPDSNQHPRQNFQQTPPPRNVQQLQQSSSSNYAHPSQNIITRPPPQQRPSRVNAPKQPENSPPKPQNIDFRQPRPPTQTPVPRPPPSASQAPEKKRVIVLRLPGPLPPGVTIPPHLLMEYAESVLAAERAGKAPPTNLAQQVLSKSSGKVSSPSHHQPRQRPTSPLTRATPPPTRPTSPPTTRPPPPPPQPQVPQRATPRGPIVPYTPRPFSKFLEDAVRHNGQTKTSAPVTHPTTSTPTRVTNYELPRKVPATESLPPTNYRPPPPSSSRTQDHTASNRAPQRNPSRNPEQRHQTQSHQNSGRNHGNTQAPPQRQPSRPPPPPPSRQPPPTTPKRPIRPLEPVQHPVKKPVQPKLASAQPPAKKFRHSTPRKYTNVKFASKSELPPEVVDDEQQVPSESRRPAYPFVFNHIQPIHQEITPKPQISSSQPHLRKDIRKVSALPNTTPRDAGVGLSKDAFETFTLYTQFKVEPLKGKRRNRNKQRKSAGKPKIIVARVNATTSSTEEPSEVTLETRSTTANTSPTVPTTTNAVALKAFEFPKEQPIANIPENVPVAPNGRPIVRRVIKKKKLRRVSTTTEYPEDHTQSHKSYDFDVFGRIEYDGEEEDLIRAAQQYYETSLQFGRRKTQTSEQ